MKKNRIVFADSLFALFVSACVSYFYSLPDWEGFLLFTSSLCMISLLVLIPVSLRHLRPGSPFLSGLRFMLSLSPLLLIVSNPGFTIFPSWASFWLGQGSQGMAWEINLFANGIIFFITGFLLTRDSQEIRPSWRETILTTIMLTAFYGATTYAGIYLNNWSWL